MRYKDLEVQRDCSFALANIADSVEYQNDVVKKGLEVLAATAPCPDARVQRDVARSYSTLSAAVHIHLPIVKREQALFTLARSLDIACQRYATLALTNLASGEHKRRVVEGGAIRPLLFLARFPDMEIQRYAALAVAGLAIGGHGNNKIRVVEEGAVRPVVDLARFPDVEKTGGIACLNFNGYG